MNLPLHEEGARRALEVGRGALLVLAAVLAVPVWRWLQVQARRRARDARIAQAILDARAGEAGRLTSRQAYVEAARAWERELDAAL